MATTVKCGKNELTFFRECMCRMNCSDMLSPWLVTGQWTGQCHTCDGHAVSTSVMILSYRYSVMMARSYSVLMAYVRQQAGDRWCT